MRFELYQPRNPEYSIVQQVLNNRGIAIKDIKHYLYTSEDDIYDYNLLDNLQEGAKMLASHIAKGSKVLV